MEKKEVRKITAGSIFSWVFGVLFLLSGLGMLTSGAFITGIIVILCSAMIIPYFNKIIADKLNFKISGGVKFLLVIVIFVAVGMGASNLSIDTTETAPKSNVNTQPQVKQQAPTKEYISKTYDDLWAVFSPNSKYTDLQKEKIFNEEYKGKYVKWTGNVIDIDTTTFTDKLVLNVRHREEGFFDLDGGRVTVYMNKNQYNKLIEISKDEEVTYSGRFSRFSDFMMTDFYVEDGEII